MISVCEYIWNVIFLLNMQGQIEMLVILIWATSQTQDSFFKLCRDVGMSFLNQNKKILTPTVKPWGTSNFFFQRVYPTLDFFPNATRNISYG